MEALGGASSIIAVVSVAIQLADGINKLLQFWSAVKDAPSYTRSLLEELQTTVRVIEGTRGIVPDDEWAIVFDAALRDCDSRVHTLNAKILLSTRGLMSQGSLKRKLAACKTAMGIKEVASLRESIERAKSTLLLAQSSWMCLQINKQVKFIAQVQEQWQDFNSKSPLTSERNSQDSAQLLYSEDGKLANYSGNALSQDQLFAQLAQNPAVVNTWQSRMRFLLCPMKSTSYVEATMSRVLQRRASAKEKSVHDFILPIFLQSWGLPSGISVTAQRTTSWQWTIRSFNSVSANALVFDFCRTGNISGLQTLFDRKEASVDDRDHKGRTPLWHATAALQRDTVEFLLKAGADDQVLDWWCNMPPLLAITKSVLNNAVAQVQIIDLYCRYSAEGYDENVFGHVIAILLLFYRPNRSIININMTQDYRLQATMNVLTALVLHLPMDGTVRSLLVHEAMSFSHTPQVVQWLLQSVGPVIRDNELLHRRINFKFLEQDTSVLKGIIAKMPDLHYCGRTFLSPEIPFLMTPTSLAMLQPRIFLAWRELLVSMGYDLEEFTRNELKRQPLLDQGWNETTLYRLFCCYITPPERLIAEGFHCERCNGGTRGILFVDLVWRRELRNIRRGHMVDGPKAARPPMFIHKSTHEDTVEAVQLDTPDSGILATDGCSDKVPGPREHWPYEVVCGEPPCRDGGCVAWVYDNDDDDEPYLPPYEGPAPAWQRKNAT